LEYGRRECEKWIDDIQENGQIAKDQGWEIKWIDSDDLEYWHYSCLCPDCKKQAATL